MLSENLQGRFLSIFQIPYKAIPKDFSYFHGHILFSMCKAFFFFPFFFFNLLFAQTFPVLIDQHLFDNKGDDIPQVLLKSQDNNLIIGGTTYFPTDTDNPADIWLLKVNPRGDILWQQHLIQEGHQELHDVQESPDGNLFAIGSSNSNIKHRELGNPKYWGDYFALRLDQSGDTLWQKTFGGSGYDFGRRLVMHDSNSFSLGGGSFSDDGLVGANQGMNDAWLSRIDADGKTKESIIWGGAENEWVEEMILAQNSDLLIGSYSNTSLTGEDLPLESSMLLRLTKDYKEVWLLPQAGKRIYGLAETSDGEVLLAGTEIKGIQSSGFWWGRVSADGELRHQRWISGPDPARFMDIASISNQGAILTGWSEGGQHPLRKGMADLWVIRTDSLDEIIWKKTWGGKHNERGRKVIQFEPGVFYVLGEKYNYFDNFGKKNLDFWLLRIEEYPCERLGGRIELMTEKSKAARGEAIDLKAYAPYAESFEWDFGDSSTSRKAQVAKRYDQPGSYMVSLKLFAGEQCEKTVYMKKKVQVK